MSVVAYVHNYADYLPAALDSILRQDFCDFELFVLDDGSTDSTAAVIERRTRDPRVRYERQDRRGRERLHETFNRCLAATSAPLVAIANGDDVMLPGKLASQLALLDSRPEIDVSFHDADFVDAEGRPRAGSFAPGLGPEVLETGRLGPWMFERDFVPNPAVVFRREIVERIGLQEYGWTHDYQFWLKAAVAGCRFHFSPERLLRYRIHERSHSTSSARLATLQAEDRRMRREMRARYSIEQLYPEVLECADAHAARASAHLDLALRLASGGLPLLELAARELEQALMFDSGLREAQANLEVLDRLSREGLPPGGYRLFEQAADHSELKRRRALPPSPTHATSRAPRPVALERGIAALARLV